MTKPTRISLPKPPAHGSLVSPYSLILPPAQLRPFPLPSPPLLLQLILGPLAPICSKFAGPTCCPNCPAETPAGKSVPGGVLSFVSSVLLLVLIPERNHPQSEMPTVLRAHYASAARLSHIDLWDSWTQTGAADKLGKRVPWGSEERRPGASSR